MNIKEYIKNTLNMNDIIEKYGIQANRAGFISCPFHNDDTPSLKIYKDSFYCFGCETGGDLINFVMEIFDIDFKSACFRINFDFHLGLLDKKMDDNRSSELIRKNRNAKKKEHDRLQKLNKLSLEHRKLWQIILAKAPTGMDKVPDEEWSKAVHEIEYVEFQIEEILLEKAR